MVKLSNLQLTSLVAGVTAKNRSSSLSIAFSNDWSVVTAWGQDVILVSESHQTPASGHSLAGSICVKQSPNKSENDCVSDFRPKKYLKAQFMSSVCCLDL